MDKETLSNYGWIVICVLVLAVMIALSGPFGTFVAHAVKSTTQGLFDVNQSALDAAGITIDDNAFPACDHTYENYKCTQCGDVIEHTCNFENNKCTLCGKELPVAGKTLKDYTWEEIKIIADLGMGDEYFNLGDTKTFTTTDGIEVVMEIIAFDADTKTDGTGTAGITWLSKNIIATRNMNSTASNANGWKESELRAWMQNDFYTVIPLEVKNVIATVNKTYADVTSMSTLSCADNIWIPSVHEVCKYTDYYGEHEGPTYTNYFNEDERRIRYDVNGNPVEWWLRSTHNHYSGYKTQFYSIVSGGYNSMKIANNTYGVVLGFCT